MEITISYLLHHPQPLRVLVLPQCKATQFRQRLSNLLHRLLLPRKNKICIFNLSLSVILKVVCYECWGDISPNKPISPKCCAIKKKTRTIWKAKYILPHDKKKNDNQPTSLKLVHIILQSILKLWSKEISLWVIEFLWLEICTWTAGSVTLVDGTGFWPGADSVLIPVSLPGLVVRL